VPVVNVCPACQRKVRVPRKAIGKTVRCPACGGAFEVTTDEATPQPALVADVEEVEPSSEHIPPQSDGGRVERNGVGLLALAQGLLALSLTLQLVVALTQLATADSSPRGVVAKPVGSVANSLTQVLAAVWVVAQVGATAVLLIGAVFTFVPATYPPLRARAGAVLLLAVVGALMTDSSFGEWLRDITAGDPSGGFRASRAADSAFAGQVLAMSLTPLVIGAAIQTMLALYARCHASRLDDRAAEQISRGLAIAYPSVVIGIFMLVMIAAVFGSQSHPTFDQVMMVLDRLFRTAFAAVGTFVLWRVWTGLKRGA
jgi:hypothetical protein